MTFILTDRQRLTPTKQDYEYLDDALKEVSKQINYTWWKTKYDSRVFYSVSSIMLQDDEEVKVTIYFHQDDMDEHPTKYGLNFRNDCLRTVERLANEILTDKRKYLKITIKIDQVPTEECKYERRNAVGNP